MVLSLPGLGPLLGEIGDDDPPVAILVGGQLVGGEGVAPWALVLLAVVPDRSQQSGQVGGPRLTIRVTLRDSGRFPQVVRVAQRVADAGVRPTEEWRVSG
jgi:hypothetical protein